MARSVCSPFPNISTSHEKNVPALPKASYTPIRLPGPYGYQEWPCDHQPPSRGWPQTPGRRQHDPQVRPPHAGLSPVSGGSASGLAWVISAQNPPASEGASQPQLQSLPRDRIIRRRTIFEATRLKGRRVSNRWMTLNFLPREAAQPGETGRVAFLTPKRLGAAHVRNQLRRRMREIYRRHLAQPEESDYLIWVARPPVLELPFDELKKCMTALRQRKG
jgi:ribonuclease P protein component